MPLPHSCGAPLAYRKGVEIFSLMHGKEMGLLRTTHPHRLQPNTDTIWVETGTNQDSYWAELRVVWLVFIHEPWPLTLDTNSWAVLKD